MAVRYNQNILTDGLTCYLDATNPKSYPGTGTVIYDLTKNARNSTMYASTTYNSNGYFTFDGIGDRDGDPTGSSAYLYANSFKGNARIWRFYDATLSDSQIRQNYNATKSRYK